MKILKIAIFVAAVLGLSVFQGVRADGNIYYLDPANGSDANDGSINSPWKTLDKMAISVAPGAIVHIRGGTYTEEQYTTTADGIFQWRTYAPFKVGSPGNPIIVSAYPGEKVIFDGGNDSYFIFFNSIYNHNYSGHFIILKNLEFINYAGVAIRGGYKDQDGIWPTRNIVIDNCSFENFSDLDTGAAVFGYSTDIIIRNSRFENMGISSGTMHPIYLAEGSKNILLDNNRIKGASGFGVHTFGHGDYNKTSENLIIRNSTIINSQSNHILVSSTNYNRVYLYNNTLFSTHNSYPPKNNSDVQNHFRFSVVGPKNVFIKNNISYGPLVQGNIQFNTWSETLTSKMIENLPNFHFDYNIWQNTNNTGRFVIDYISSSDSSHSRSYTFDEFRAMTGESAKSQVTDPLFNDQNNFDLTLKGNSPAIDAGDFLTHTTNAGSGTDVAVQDAGYFIDGYDVAEGDTIRIGSETVAIADIDYQNNILTLDRNISWQSNDNVSLPYSSSRPDIGAYEYANPADVNNSGSVNIKDIQICIKAIVAPGSIPETYLNNCKKVAPPEITVNIKDIQEIIRAIVNP